MLTDLTALFPKLQACGYRRTSPPTHDYNCIAWAAGDSAKWWEPDPYNLMYWPDGVPRQSTLSSYIAAYASIGYKVCPDGSAEADFEKIALYTVNGIPKHAARQLLDGSWSSKLGPLDDIAHTLEGIESPQYGTATVFMRRPL
jgi:hypothetical protein